MAKTRVSASQRDALERARSAKRQRQDGGKGKEREAALQSRAATPAAAPATRRRSGHAAPVTAVTAAQDTAAGSSPAGRKRAGGPRRLRSQKREQETPSTAEEEAEGEEGDEAEGAELGGHQLQPKSLQSVSGGLEDRRTAFACPVGHIDAVRTVGALARRQARNGSTSPPSWQLMSAQCTLGDSRCIMAGQ